MIFLVDTSIECGTAKPYINEVAETASLLKTSSLYAFVAKSLSINSSHKMFDVHEINFL